MRAASERSYRGNGLKQLVRATNESKLVGRVKQASKNGGRGQWVRTAGESGGRGQLVRAAGKEKLVSAESGGQKELVRTVSKGSW